MHYAFIQLMRCRAYTEKHDDDDDDDGNVSSNYAKRIITTGGQRGPQHNIAATERAQSCLCTCFGNYMRVLILIIMMTQLCSIYRARVACRVLFVVIA